MYWPADARRVREVIRDRGGLTFSSPTGELGPGHYTFPDPEGGLRQAVEVDIDIPVLVELRLRRAAVGLRVGDTATAEDRSEEDLAAVLDEYDFLTGVDGGLLKFHPRFVDNVDVLRVSVGADGLHWRPHRQFLAEVPQSIAGWLMTRHPDLVSEPRTYDVISAMLREFGHEAPFEVVEPLRVHSHQAAGETVPALSKERMDKFLDAVWDMRNDITSETRVHRLYDRKVSDHELTMSNEAYLEEILAIADGRLPGSSVKLQLRRKDESAGGDAGPGEGGRIHSILAPRRRRRVALSRSGVRQLPPGRDAGVDARPRSGGGWRPGRVRRCADGESGKARTSLQQNRCDRRLRQ